MPAENFLILSGTYVGADLTAEFGRLPPSFLPVGTRRLFEEQLDFARNQSARTAMTLPSDFEMTATDAQLLERAGVDLVRLPPGLSLGGALARAIDAIGVTGRLILLFGDTLVGYGDGTSEPDTFATGATDHFAVWAQHSVREDGTVQFRESLPLGRAESNVVCGLFDFSNAARLRACLSEGVGFFQALNAYVEGQSFQPRPVSRWLDFGHLQTYYQSRKNDLAARDFNRIRGSGVSLVKTGAPGRKIYAEANWFQQIPPALRPFTPQLTGFHSEPEVAYEIEYLYLPTLSELFCFGDLSEDVWRGILGSCQEFLELCRPIHPLPHEVPLGFERRFFDDIVRGKTLDRMQLFAREQDLDLDRDWKIDGRREPSLRALAEALIAMVDETQASDISLWHGDFHFANLLYDFRAQRVKCIDPRGMLSDGSLSIFGDARYDLAKLNHSVIGLYDFIVSDRFRLSRDGYEMDLEFDLPSGVRATQGLFEEMRIGGYDVGSKEILAMTALLFLSMAPLHGRKPTRQFAMLANAYRLHRMAAAK